MGYSIYLNDPVTGEIARVPGHLMIGSTYKAEYHPETGSFTPAVNVEAELNITYNYGCYYREIHPEEGIRVIYGKSGAQSILILEEMIFWLENKYKVEGKWIHSERYEGPDENYWSSTAANAIRPLYQLKALAEMRPDCIWKGD